MLFSFLGTLVPLNLELLYSYFKKTWGFNLGLKLGSFLVYEFSWLSFDHSVEILCPFYRYFDA